MKKWSKPISISLVLSLMQNTVYLTAGPYIELLSFMLKADKLPAEPGKIHEKSF